MKIKYIEAKNFRSYKYFKLPLENRGIILMSQINGTGKSSSIYAMIYALYGETPDGAKGDEVIKKGIDKDCFARVEFEHFNHDYVVTRYRKNKDYKNKVIVKRDGKDITLPSNRATDKKIEQILGFGFDTLLNSMIFSPERLNTFINSTDKQRKKILEELTNTNIYKQAQELVKTDRDMSRQKLSDVSKEIDHTNTLLESQKGLERQYELNKRNHEQQLQSLQNQIKNLQVQAAKIKVDNTITTDALKASYNDCNQQIKALQAQLGPNTDSQELVKINNQLTQSQAQQKQLRQQLLDLMQTSKQLMNSKLPTCKWCGSKLNAQHKQIELNNINTQAIKLGQQYNAMDQPIQGLKAKQQSLKAKIESVAGQNKQLNAQITTLSQKQQYYLLKLNQNRANQKSKEQLNSQIASLSTQYQVEQNKQIKAVHVNTRGLEDNLAKYNQEQDKLEQDQRDYQSLIQIYSDRGVKAQALSVVLPFLNQELAKILKVLTDNQLTASLESHTKTKSGKVNNQISLQINSAVSGPNYQDLSSGEKRRIGIALNIAFMQYLKSQIGGLNLAVFDEVFDNLDQAGIDKVLDVLAKLKSDIPNILIMSHNDDLIYNDNIDARIKIKKTNGTSEIIK